MKTANKVYVLKGGPGTGKSSFLKRVAKSISEEGIETHYIHCSSDPHSLDGVYFPKLKCAFVDGTSPHVIDLVYPAAVDSIIYFGEFWDEEKISANKKEIIILNDEVKNHFSKAYKYLSSAKHLLNDTYATAYNYLNLDKLSKYAHNFVNKYLKPLNKKSIITKRFLQGITPEGIISFDSDLSNKSSKTFVIKDLYHLTPILLTEIRDIAASRGLDIDVYYHPMAPETDIDALYFPEYNISVITSVGYYPYDNEYYRCIHMKRFVNTDELKRQKIRLRFNMKAYESLIEEAVKSLKEAKNLHDKLETYYTPYMDFKSIEKLSDIYIEKLKQIK